MKHIRFALAQLNAHVGNLNKNLNLAIQACTEACSHQANIIVFPELFLVGYIPQDLLLEPHFVQKCHSQLQDFIQKTKHLDITIIVGSIHKQFTSIYNAAYVIYKGECLHIYHKRHLPNIEVFDEQRYFTAGERVNHINLYGIHIELAICEDIWHDKPNIHKHNMQQTKSGEADVLIVVNASPYTIDKYERRIKHLKHYTQNQQHAIYVNMVGGRDEIVFDGASFYLDAYGTHTQLLSKFEQNIAYLDYSLEDNVESNESNNEINISALNSVEILNDIKAPTSIQPKWIVPEITPKAPILHSAYQNLEDIYQALVLATRDYVHKNGFSKVVVGLSGGVDSALVACIAAHALGHENVHTIMMPSQYTHSISLEDAHQLAQNLGISHEIISIQAIIDSFKLELMHSQVFSGLALEVDISSNILNNDVTYENLQARIRGNILMAYANRTNTLVLTTGNKSELAVGYCTLYGDMCGAFAPIKDVLKTQVYQICHYLNEKYTENNYIPERILTRAPSAELKPNQTDQDNLPPYDVLDAILIAYIEHKKDVMSIHEQTNIALSTVEKIVRLVKLSEYKRQQSVLGPKISNRSFGKDWRYDISAAISG
jgi:NAD+ synthase (glutamine-hydrolysing)